MRPIAEHEPYYVVHINTGDVCAVFATLEEAIADAKECGAGYIVEYREVLFRTETPLAKAG